MKNQILNSIVFALAVLTFTSCGKDREAIKAAISDQQLADLVESALQEEMAGLTEQVATMVDIAQQNVVAQCGLTKDTTIVSENETLIGSASYTTDYTWTLECENDVTPLNYDFVCHTEGSYSNNRMSSNDSGDANWKLSGLSESVNEFLANGVYSRNGEQTFKSDGTYTESKMDMTVTNLAIDKASEEITGGIAQVNASGKTDSGESFTFDGEITFKGNGKATLTVNGKTFNLKL